MAESDDCAPSALSTTTRGDSIGSGGVSFSSGSSMTNSGSSSSISTKTALSECSGAWINYLSVLNNLCSAGAKLAQSIVALEQCNQNMEKTFRPVCGEKNLLQNTPSNYLATSWNDLARATTIATSTVKLHIIAVLQDFKVIPSVEPSQLNEVEQQRMREHNHLVIIENTQTMINVHHQFCAASYDAFSSLTSCLVCQAPVGFPHETDCSMIKQKSHFEQRSQTPSPHFGASQRPEVNRVGSSSDQRGATFGSNSSHFSNEPVYTGFEPSSAQSPQSSFRDASPLQGILENICGPLPNPGRLLTMKVPFYRNAKSPLNFPLFPLNGQRRWSEAAAGEVCNENLTDVESQMRRWSMPWEASKTDQNTVTWYQTRMMSMNAVKLSNQKFISSERSASNTPDSPWQSSATSQDGLAEAIQLLSCRPLSNTIQLHPMQMMPSVDISLLDEQGSSITSSRR